MKNNMKRLRVSRGEIAITHNYRYSCGFRTTRLYECCREHEEFSTSGVFDI